MPALRLTCYGGTAEVFALMAERGTTIRRSMLSGCAGGWSGKSRTMLLNGMKTVGDLFASGEMQLPFVLKSAETIAQGCPSTRMGRNGLAAGCHSVWSVYPPSRDSPSAEADAETSRR